MEQVLKLIKLIISNDVQFITDEQRLRPKDSEVFRLWGDNSLICKLTQWTPEYTIRQGLEETVDWFTKPYNLKNYKAGIYNV
jgi:nucleoside-diphosphate-sugar epimerase